MSRRSRRASSFASRVGAGLVVILVTTSACGSTSPTVAPSTQASASVVPNEAATPTVTPAPSATATTGASPAPRASGSPVPSDAFPNGVLIADEGNARLLAIAADGRILWQFPTVPGAVPTGQEFTADDAFFAPDGKTIAANDETHQVIDRIDIATGKVVWQYGHYGVHGSATGYLHNPDDAYPLANGNILVADIVNCRILEIAPSKEIVRTIGETGVCRVNAPTSYGDPNGDTPLADGGILITEIYGSRVVRLSATGQVVFDIHVPAAYPSDAQLDAQGNIVLADYSNPGAVLAVTPAGKLLWRYAPTSGAGRLDHPSLATPLPDGNVMINDDFRHRMVVIDPRTMKIVWQYGHTDVASSGAGYLSQPDGHQPIPDGIQF